MFGFVNCYKLGLHVTLFAVSLPLFYLYNLSAVKMTVLKM